LKNGRTKICGGQAIDLTPQHQVKNRTMNSFALIKPTDVPEEAQSGISAVTKMFGFTPNVALVMGQSPVALNCYLSNLQSFGRTSFTPVEQQFVLLAVSIANRSPYSVAVHSSLAQQAGADPAALAAIRAGRPITDLRLEQLRRFTQLATIKRGNVCDAEMDAFLAAGFDPQHMVEVMFGIATKTFANYLQAIFEPELDAAFKPFEWSPP
jgi:AhpD family alkylhydroperoxidase